ncbi:SHOCT domain-containing protein [Methanobrevibacter thaueri]|uniref:SHOCT domain-containing protein n=1 Tax=Methanobrevibacter thaueri TaxID=190975 RepID=A0A315XPS9_9EURY|nr:SHOCT domain-containing protein [Methanobrevibacter thaueri]PWB87894.1 hypothetical protein MBBTH_04810 [Methanobrevibacter thaueri]
MGLLDNFKKSDEEIKEEALMEYNIFEGISALVTFPDKQLKIGTHSGAARGVATLAFGLIGLAAASGVKQKEEFRTLRTLFQIVEKGLVFKNATLEGKDLRIPYDNVVGAERVKEDDLVITLLENQEIFILFKFEKIGYRKFVVQHVIDIINQRACGAQYEEVGWGLEHATAKPQETKQESKSLMDELERLANLYEKGLLTDEEFAAMKKKLIDGD